MAEIDFRHRIRDRLKPGFVQQVENAVGPGTPDTYYAFEGVSGWLELKFGREIPKRDTTAVFKSLNRGLELEQESWIYQCARNGGNAWVLAQIVDRYFLVHGMIAHDFNVMTYPQFERYELDLKHLKAIVKSYAVAGTGDNHASWKCEPPHPHSLWYSQVRYAFRPSAEGIFLERQTLPVDERDAQASD